MSESSALPLTQSATQSGGSLVSSWQFVVAPVSTIENTAISNSETTIEDTHSIEINTQNLPTHIQQELDLFTSWASTFRGCTNNILGLIHSDISPKQAGDFFHAVSIARKQAGGIIDKTTIH